MFRRKWLPTKNTQNIHTEQGWKVEGVLDWGSDSVFFLYSYVALVSPKKARFILGSFASETDKSHLLEGGGCFFFSSHPWYLFFFFCDSLNSLESTLEIEPLQQNSPLDRICRGKLGMLRQAVDALPKRSQRRLGGMVIGWSWIVEIPFNWRCWKWFFDSFVGDFLGNAVSLYFFGGKRPKNSSRRKKNSDEKQFRGSEAYDIHTRNETNLVV